MSDKSIEFLDKLPAALEKRMSEGLNQYDKEHGIDVNYKPFLLTITNDADHVVGVLKAYTAFSEIYVDDLWVDKEYRHKGYGRKLLQALENKFKGQGFNNINLVTSEFSAPGFYEKCGFTQEFVRENKHNPKLTKYFFVKFFDEQDQWQGSLL